MPDQITSFESRNAQRYVSVEEHEDCQATVSGYWYDYGDVLRCTRCGEEKPDKPQTRSVPVKKAAPRRPTK